MIPGGEEKCENLRKSCRDFSLNEGIAFQRLAIKPYASSTVENLQLAISGKKDGDSSLFGDEKDVHF